MAVLLGFFTQIAAQLLKMTYLNRTEPETPATSVLSELQIEVLQAKSKKSPPSVLTPCLGNQDGSQIRGLFRTSKK